MAYLLMFLIWFPFAGAFVVYGIGRFHKTARDYAAAAAGLLEFAAMSAAAFWVYRMFADGNLLREMPGVVIPGVCGMGLSFTLDGFRCIYGLIAAFMWFATLLFSREYFLRHRNRNRYYLFNLMTLGALLGVFFSADLFTAFIFFEIMSFTSYVWVVQEENKEALRAGETYLAVAVIGGLAMLLGLFFLYHQLGTLDMEQLFEAVLHYENRDGLYLAGALIFAGYAAKAGAFPLHIWLPKAHPVAPAPASALLSGILTKSGIFGMIAVSANLFWHDGDWGIFVLIIGVITMFLGAILAVFSVDIKRTLACSSMSQIGFILLGIGMQGILGEENAPAVRGTFLHMVNHSLFKLVLFLAAGAVYMNAHRLDLNAVRGFGRKKKLLHAVFLSAALGIGGIPLFSGYISKTLLHEAIVEGIAVSGGNLLWFLKLVEWLFLISGGMTIAYMAKLYVAIFWEKNADALLQRSYDEKKPYWTVAGAAPVVFAAGLVAAFGLLPQIFMDKIADFGGGFFGLTDYAGSVSYFSPENLKGAAISVIVGGVIYAGIRKFLMREAEGGREYFTALPKWMDLENLIYRPLLLKILPFLGAVACRVLDSLTDFLIVSLRKSVYRDRKIPHELPEGNALTHMLGRIFDGARRGKRKLLRRESPEHEVTYEHRFAVQWEKFIETNTIIGRSLSFGLLLFYVGLVFTLFYLLLCG